MNTHWIDYEPGTAARVSDKLPHEKKLQYIKDTDVNRLSRIVAKFNDWLTRSCGRVETIEVKLSRLNMLFNTL